jgi:hypothetical protein
LGAWSVFVASEVGLASTDALLLLDLLLEAGAVTSTLGLTGAAVIVTVAVMVVVM